MKGEKRKRDDVCFKPQAKVDGIAKISERMILFSSSIFESIICTFFFLLIHDDVSSSKLHLALKCVLFAIGNN